MRRPPSARSPTPMRGGWAGQTSDSGIVHRSPRIAGSGMLRRLLGIDLPAPCGAANRRVHRRHARRPLAQAKSMNALT